MGRAVTGRHLVVVSHRGQRRYLASATDHLRSATTDRRRAMRLPHDHAHQEARALRALGWRGGVVVRLREVAP